MTTREDNEDQVGCRSKWQSIRMLASQRLEVVYQVECHSCCIDISNDVPASLHCRVIDRVTYGSRCVMAEEVEIFVSGDAR